MIYIDSKFRFYDDSKDLVKFPELKPTPDAVALTDEQVTAITAGITRWRWHPVENKPYKLPDCDKKYWVTVDGVILEMDEAEKAAVDQAEADVLAAKLAAEQAAAEAAALAQAELDAKIAAIADAKAAIASLVPAVDKATDIEGLKKVVLDLIKNVQAITA
jgi:hypothetical protein